MTKLLCVAVGGAFGATLRYLVAGWVQHLAGNDFPAGTLAVNLLGCFIIGFAGMMLSGPFLVREEVRLAFLVGGLGGFTTFSTYAWESFSLLNNGQPVRALANIVVSTGFGLTAAWAGYRLAEKWYGV